MTSAAPSTPVIVDCDPGHDDAVALLVALKRLNVVGVTTVAGNQTLEKVTANARKILALACRDDIPVLRGSREPFDERPWFADRVHGEFGLDGVNLPEPGVDLTPGHAVDFIIDRARSSEELAIIALGPLTNVAAVLQREPALTSGISGIWLMGGSFGPGNVSPAAEFNIAFDPEAADVVFAAGIPLRMCGLNLTRQVGAGDKEINRFRAISNRIGPVVADLVQFHRKRTRDVYGSDTVPIHDACAVASFVAPELITFRRMHVGVELRGEQTRGMTVCDARFADVSRPDWAPVPNADVGIEIDREGFFNLLCDSLVAYD